MRGWALLAIVLLPAAAAGPNLEHPPAFLQGGLEDLGATADSTARDVPVVGEYAMDFCLRSHVVWTCTQSAGTPWLIPDGPVEEGTAPPPVPDRSAAEAVAGTGGEGVAEPEPSAEPGPPLVLDVQRYEEEAPGSPGALADPEGEGPVGPPPSADGPREAGAGRSGWGAGAWVAVAAVAIVPWALAAKLAVVALRRAPSATSAVRDAILEAVRRHPGIRHRQLMRAVARANGTLEHQLGRLLEAGSVTRVRVGGATAYFGPAGASEEQARLNAALSGATTRRLMRLVAASRSIGMAEAAKGLGTSLPTLSYHAAKLAKAGAVTVSRDGGIRRLAATPAGRAAASTDPDLAP